MQTKVLWWDQGIGFGGLESRDLGVWDLSLRGQGLMVVEGLTSQNAALLDARSLFCDAYIIQEAILAHMLHVAWVGKRSRYDEVVSSIPLCTATLSCHA